MIKLIKDWIVPLIIGVVIALIVETFFGIAAVDGHSMDPTLHNTQKLIINKKEKIKRFDIVVFNAKNVDPNDTKNLDYIKRIIGLPGDNITYRPNGDLIINGRTIHQTFISKEAKTTDTLTLVNHQYPKGFTLKNLSDTQHWTKPLQTNVIPKGYYFVMGDNRKVSNDGRYWGLVPENKIIGVTHRTLTLHKIN